MSKQARGTVIRRIAIVLVFLEQPRTAKQLAQKLDIKADCAYVYLDMLRKAGYPLRSREKFVAGTGLNPMEYWVDYHGIIVLEALRLLKKLQEIK